MLFLETMIKTAQIPYTDQEAILEAFVAYPSEQRRPAVILCHAWGGRDAFICNKAEIVAGWEYVGFALDIYGKDVLGKSKEENAALKKPFIEDRSLLQRRLLKAFDLVSSLPYVDATRIAALGFGFGGISALDLARSGIPLRGAISVYGHFAPSPLSKKPIRAKILALHGYRDPIINSAELLAFEKEMDAARADWQLHIYGDAMHAFANPTANDMAAGIVYNSTSDRRAWTTIASFLKEVLS